MYQHFNNISADTLLFIAWRMKQKYNWNSSCRHSHRQCVIFCNLRWTVKRKQIEMRFPLKLEFYARRKISHNTFLKGNYTDIHVHLNCKKLIKFKKKYFNPLGTDCYQTFYKWSKLTHCFDFLSFCWVLKFINYVFLFSLSILYFNIKI